MKKAISFLLLSALALSLTVSTPVNASPESVKTALFAKKKKKYKGFKKPKSKKILGIFKRKSDCGCPNH